MKQTVNPVLALIIILGALGVVGFFYWRVGRDRPIPDGPGGGRIGRTLNLGKTVEQLKAEGKYKEPKPDKPKADKAKSAKTPAGT